MQFQQLTSQEHHMSTLKQFPLILASALVLSACGTTTKLDNSAAAAPQPVQAHADTQPVGQTKAALDPLDDPNSPLAKRSVYFDYDSYVVKGDYKPLVSAHANYLAQHGDRTIVIQGNADERGSSEYNLALGQKRAEAVRKSLLAIGIPSTRMEAVSFGKEKPKATGHDEAAWSQNRRADIVYNGK